MAMTGARLRPSRVVGPARLQPACPPPRSAAHRGRRPTPDPDVEPDLPWIVLVWNDPINLMSYVVFVLQKLFGYNLEKATALMLDVHHKGRAVVSSGTPGEGRARRVPPPRARPVGHDAAGRAECGCAAGSHPQDRRRRFDLRLPEEERAVAALAGAPAARAARATTPTPGAGAACSPPPTPTTREREAEYQAMVHDDLVAGRLRRHRGAGGHRRRHRAGRGRSGRLDAAPSTTVRLVLGTQLDVARTTTGIRTVRPRTIPTTPSHLRPVRLPRASCSTRSWRSRCEGRPAGRRRWVSWLVPGGALLGSPLSTGSGPHRLAA